MTTADISEPYYHRHGVTVHGGDCLDVLRSMPDASVDAVVTDPPYGLANHKPAALITALTAWANGDREHVPDGRGFMGRDWDAFVPPPAVWDECLRVLKPGGHLLAFAGSRTYDLMGLSIRMAGFEIRDGLQWLYGSGFPKGIDVSKAIDKRGGTNGAWFAEWLAEARTAAGLMRNEVSAHFPSKAGGVTGKVWNWESGHGVCTQAEFDQLCDLFGQARRPVFEVEGEFIAARQGRHGRFGPGDTRANARRCDITAPATPEAQRWEGWNTSLKPAHEPIVMARKPLVGTVAANVLAHGTGGLNVDACRTAHVSTADRATSEAKNRHTAFANPGSNRGSYSGSMPPRLDYDGGAGRWPSNVLLSHNAECAGVCAPGCQVAELDAQSGTSTSSDRPRHNTAVGHNATASMGKSFADWTTGGHADRGGASRFFPVFRWEAKAPASERPKVAIAPVFRLRADLTEQERTHVLAELTRSGTDVA